MNAILVKLDIPANPGKSDGGSQHKSREEEPSSNEALRILHEIGSYLWQERSVVFMETKFSLLIFM